ncbi:hypothetical protein [Macrococcoides caseolyticum]|uniref:hypothetical protein n=1 Tax=Macrococcoides caseolyticum TaxID=69966 RepID=UPI001F1C41AE|nr:hypothetical protein [Macrococcus caseolyticus]MCE4957033.1 hypothetical protein [Macrococcus caseolyticus]
MQFDTSLVYQLSNVHEYIGKQTIYLQYNTKALEKLKFAGLFQNVKYACALSGLSIADTKLKQLLQFRKSFENDVEAQIVGYRDAYLFISEDYEFIDINLDTMMTLYLELTLGDMDTINHLSNAVKTELMQLCDDYNEVMLRRDTITLIEIFHVVYSFIQINAFKDKTLLFSRLFLNLLLFKAGILVTQYQSLDQFIFQSMSHGKNKIKKKWVNYFKFEDETAYTRFYLERLIECFEALEFNFKLILDENVTPSIRVLNVLNKSFEPISRQELEMMLADISRKTIERALVQLQSESFIEKVGQGKATKYRVI